MCPETKLGGLLEDPERLERYQNLFAKAFPGQTALDVLHRNPAENAKKQFFIDSCVFLGILIKDKNTKACKSFISRVNNDVYIGYISPFVTGEIINSILYDNKIKNELKSDMLHAVVDLLISVKVNNFVPSKNAMKVYSKLREADERISESDMMHLVCAKILDIPLLTTDDMMLKSQRLKKHVNIISPSDCHQ